MPRPRVHKETSVISASVERSLAERLRREAALKGIPLSRLVEEVLAEWLSSRSPEGRGEAGDLDPLANGGQRSESERRWELLRKLDEYEVERFPKDVELLAYVVEQLEKTPVSMRRTESYLNRLSRARRRLIALKKVARRLLSAGYPLDEKDVERLVELERRLDKL
jgi:hypothetical protein